MTLRQRRAKRRTAFTQRAFDTAHGILEGSGLRYQSQQIDGLANVLMTYAEDEIRRWREPMAAPPSPAKETP